MDLTKKMKNFFTLTRKANGGFTLVELIVVIAIMAILAGVAVPAYSGYVEKANEAADQQQLAALNTAFASACAINGEDHTYRNDVTANIEGGMAKVRVANVEGFKETFDSFYDGGVFKYFGYLRYIEETGVFEGQSIAAILEEFKEAMNNGTGFNDQGVIEDIMGYFDSIGDFLDNGETLDILLSQIPESVADALGFTEMFSGFADMGVEHFVNDAAGRTAEEVMEGAKSLMALLTPAYDGTAEDITDGEMLSAYKATLTEEELALFESANQNEDAQIAAVKNSLGVEFGDLDLDAKQVVAVMNNIGDQKNNADISGLSGMYALAAGFYNSTYYDADTMGAKPDSFAEFSAVESAMVYNNAAFMEYMDSDQATKDMEAYVSYMKYLSTGEYDSYSGEGFEYIKEALGWG